ncbi:unnamed protein product [Amoebophrya sp. A25]|nr:unnamed protein product [Amoebophrya sp. A25]|eukprot:GSA25T00027841001.1
MQIEKMELQVWKQLLAIDQRCSAIASTLVERRTALQSVGDASRVLEVDDPSATPIGVVGWYLQEEADSLQGELSKLQMERSRLLNLLDRVRVGEVCKVFRFLLSAHFRRSKKLSHRERSSLRIFEGPQN